MVAFLLKERLVEPGRLVWLARLANLQAVTAETDGALRIGAGVTLSTLARSAEVRRCCPSLALAAGQVGNPRVRSVATLGGHLAHADPRQDLLPVLLALDAQVTTACSAGRREFPLDQLFAGPMETTLRPGELITQITVPSQQGRRDVYLSFKPGSVQDYPTVGVAATAVTDAYGVVRDARVALAGVGPTPLLVAATAQILSGRSPQVADIREVATAAADAARPTDDQRGSEGYKRAMTALWTARALTNLLAPMGENDA